MILAATVALAGLANPEYVTCKLAKRITVYGEKICLYVHVNGGRQMHYPTTSFSECPRSYQCRYAPQDKGRTLKDTMDALKEQFE
jgi:hypothetical protein